MKKRRKGEEKQSKAKSKSKVKKAEQGERKSLGTRVKKTEVKS